MYYSHLQKQFPRILSLAFRGIIRDSVSQFLASLTHALDNFKLMPPFYIYNQSSKFRAMNNTLPPNWNSTTYRELKVDGNIGSSGRGKQTCAEN